MTWVTHNSDIQTNQLCEECYKNSNELIEQYIFLSICKFVTIFFFLLVNSDYIFIWHASRLDVRFIVTEMIFSRFTIFVICTTTTLYYNVFSRTTHRMNNMT